MITCTPRSAAVRANFAIRSGVRCAETIRCSLGTPNFSSSATACCMVSQSEALPMTTLTRAGRGVFLAIKADGQEAFPSPEAAKLQRPFSSRPRDLPRENTAGGLSRCSYDSGTDSLPSDRPILDRILWLGFVHSHWAGSFPRNGRSVAVLFRGSRGRDCSPHGAY